MRDGETAEAKTEKRQKDKGAKRKADMVISESVDLSAYAVLRHLFREEGYV